MLFILGGGINESFGAPELRTVHQHQVLVLVKGLQLTDVGLVILEDDSDPVVDEVCHLESHLGEGGLLVTD